MLIRFSRQAVINSTITPNMMFTKTSQKFGQWSDMRANTVYGLGFSTEAELNKVGGGPHAHFCSLGGGMGRGEPLGLPQWRQNHR